MLEISVLRSKIIDRYGELSNPRYSKFQGVGGTGRDLGSGFWTPGRAQDFGEDLAARVAGDSFSYRSELEVTEKQSLRLDFQNYREFLKNPMYIKFQRLVVLVRI